jgi:hypothetical protein
MIGYELGAGRLNGLIAFSCDFNERLASRDVAGAQVIKSALKYKYAPSNIKWIRDLSC